MADLTITLDLRQFRDFEGKFRRATSELMTRQRDVAERAARGLVIPSLQRHAPVGTHYTPEGVAFTTEELRKSIRLGGFRSIPTKSPTAAGAAYGTSLDILMAAHGKFTLFDTTPHLIFPRTGKCLRFFWPGVTFTARQRLTRTMEVATPGGSTVYLQKVVHPGTIGHRWDMDALAEVGPQLIEELHKVCRNFLVSIQGG